MSNIVKLKQAHEKETTRLLGKFQDAGMDQVAVVGTKLDADGIRIVHYGYSAHLSKTELLGALDVVRHHILVDDWE